MVCWVLVRSYAFKNAKKILKNMNDVKEWPGYLICIYLLGVHVVQAWFRKGKCL